MHVSKCTSRLQFDSLCDTETLRSVFYQLGFTVEVRSNLTAGDMKRELKNLGSRNFLEDDVLVRSLTPSERKPQ